MTKYYAYVSGMHNGRRRKLAATFAAFFDAENGEGSYAEFLDSISDNYAGYAPSDDERLIKAILAHVPDWPFLHEIPEGFEMTIEVLQTGKCVAELRKLPELCTCCGQSVSSATW
jgi:hypothetical protein